MEEFFSTAYELIYGNDLCKIEVFKYFTYKGRMKQVVYFVAKQTGGFEKKQDSEIKSMKWLNFEDAFQKITYPNTKKIFGKVLMDLK